jgi:hypothetical protein
MRAAVLVLGLVATSSPVGAESQEGGLPGLSARLSVAEQVASALGSTILSLQGQVTSLQSALSAESAARAAADAALQTALTQEAAARKSQDDAEAAERTADVKQLRDLIDGAGSKAFSAFKSQSVLQNGASGLVGSVGPFPAGNYAVMAKAVVQDFEPNTSWSCELRTDDGRAIDRTAGFTTLNTGNAQMIENIALATLTAAGSIRMICETHVSGPSCGASSCSSLFDIAMIAVQVADVQIGCPDVQSCQ